YSKEMRRWLASMMRRRGLRDVEGQDLDDLVQLCWHKYFAALVGPCQRQGIETSTRYRYQIVRNVFFDQVRRGQVRQAVRRSQWVRLRDVAPDVIVYYQSTDEKGVVGKAIRDHRSVDPMEAAERREQIGVLRTWINRLESMGRHVLAAVLAALVESWGDKEAASRKLSMSMSTLNRNLSRMRNLLEEAGGLSAAQIRNWPIPVAKEGAVSSGNRFGAFQISADDDGAGGLHKREFDILDYNVPSEAVDQYGDSYCLGLA
ncbi:MAG TPA: hypothetical protein VKU02_06115, partial [Gemmataceae bacterium]|nr:hypothetical protein [Gemmataceae bacterium]